MYIRVPRLGIKSKIVTVKRSSREPGCVPNYPALRYACMHVYTECPELTAPVGGSVIITGFTPGNVAIYSCDDGLQLSGDTLRTCLPTGEWTGDDPICIGE